MLLVGQQPPPVVHSFETLTIELHATGLVLGGGLLLMHGSHLWLLLLLRLDFASRHPAPDGLLLLLLLLHLMQLLLSQVHLMPVVQTGHSLHHLLLLLLGCNLLGLGHVDHS